MLSLLRTATRTQRATIARATVTLVPRRTPKPFFLAALALGVAESSFHSSSVMSECAAGAKQSAASGGQLITYDMLQQADVQTVDVTSSSNPLPTGSKVKLGSLIPEDGAVIYLVRRPGCSLCRGDGAELAKVFARYFPSAAAGSQPATITGEDEATVKAKVSAAASAAAGNKPQREGKPALLMLFKENLSVKEGSSEIRDFLPSVPGGFPLLHEDRSLYDALGQKPLGLMDMMSFSLVSRYRSLVNTYGGHLKGEGSVRGAIIVVGSKQQGVLANYLEQLGSDIDFEKIEHALQQLKGAKQQQGAPSAAAVGSSKL